jgi:hypothetical protein
LCQAQWDRYDKQNNQKKNYLVEKDIIYITESEIKGSNNLLYVFYLESSVALHLISMFLLLSLCRYLCWWTISPRGYHPPGIDCFYHCVDISAGGRYRHSDRNNQYLADDTLGD